MVRVVARARGSFVSWHGIQCLGAAWQRCAVASPPTCWPVGWPDLFFIATQRSTTRPCWNRTRAVVTPRPCRSQRMSIANSRAGSWAVPVRRAKLARFLARLEELDPPVRRGLLKTWFHTGGITSMLREAESLAPSDNGTQRVQPIDALVAPFGRCNLHCRGCYAAQELEQPSATAQQLDNVIDQLVRLNVYHVLLVGKGEPFFDDASRACLFEAVLRHPQVFFSVFTNGTSILPRDIRQLKRCPHVIPVLSLDGAEEINDWRRGEGVYRHVIATCQRLREAGLLFGYIATVFNQNYEVVLHPAFVGRMVELGCRVGYYSLFITPEFATGNTAEDCRNMMLNPQRREEYFRRFGELDAAVAIPLIDVDGIEAHFGCLRDWQNRHRTHRGHRPTPSGDTRPQPSQIRTPAWTLSRPSLRWAASGSATTARRWSSWPQKTRPSRRRGTRPCASITRTPPGQDIWWSS